jgi:MOSC domain-containing protein YiiM
MYNSRMESQQGTVISLQLCVGHRKPMVFVESADVIEGLGLRGDRHAVAGSNSQILLIEDETLEDLRLSRGQLKENITTRGIRLMEIRRGQRMQVGDETVFEITKACTPCGRTDEIRSGLQSQLAGRRCILARALRGGVIRIGDTIKLL